MLARLPKLHPTMTKQRSALRLRQLATLFLLVAPVSAQEIYPLSLDTTASPTNGPSRRPAISSDGRYVAFESSATDLVAGDTNGVQDVFLRDHFTGTTRRVSVASSGAQASGASEWPALSADGRYVAFSSLASNLVPSDSNSAPDVFVHDTLTGQTILVSPLGGGGPANGGSYSPDISADGAWVVFMSIAPSLDGGASDAFMDVFASHIPSNSTSKLSRTAAGQNANGSSFFPRISPDGRYVSFETEASNLTSGDVNLVRDVVLHDLVLGVTTPVTANPASLIGNGVSFESDVSADGAFVVFTSFATNLVAADTNNFQDVFRWRRDTGAIQRVSVSSAGAQGVGQSFAPSVSDNGLVVAFATFAANLALGDANLASDVLLRNIPLALTTRVSSANGGAAGNAGSTRPALSASASVIAFETLASDLFVGDTNGASDVVASGDRCPGAAVYCVAKVNSGGCVPAICSYGSPSLTAAQDFHVVASRVLNQKSGLLFWGLAPASAPFFGGTRCVEYPVVRTPVQDSGGATNVNDCSGRYDYAFSSAYLNAAGLVAGNQVYAQFWSRDPFFAPPSNIGLTDAAQFTILP